MSTLYLTRWCAVPCSALLPCRSTSARSGLEGPRRQQLFAAAQSEREWLCLWRVEEGGSNAWHVECAPDGAPTLHRACSNAGWHVQLLCEKPAVVRGHSLWQRRVE